MQVKLQSENSAWGSGSVDNYHYFGYKRNQQYFLVKDYTEIPDSGLLNVLEHCGRRMVLMGDACYDRYLINIVRNACVRAGSWAEALFREDISYYKFELFRRLLDITWSDTLLETTLHGQPSYYDKITGFDPVPVSRTHDQYFSDYSAMAETVWISVCQ